MEEDTEEGKMNYEKRYGAPLGLMGNSRVSRRLRLFFSEHVRALDSDHSTSSLRVTKKPLRSGSCSIILRA